MIFTALCLAAASCSGSAATPSAGPAGSLRVRSCYADGRIARCGTLIVPEDRLTGQGRTIPVRFVVIPATGPGRAPDPVVFFAGGPGDSAVGDIPAELPQLTDLNMHRDLVFIDQRGTGGSNPLTCPAFPGLADRSRLRASIESCLAHLNGDLRFYTTAMFADDVSQVLTALHYGKADLLGGSYGVTAEQVFLLRHPGQVRTMTLYSGSLLSVPMFERFPGNAQLALGHALARCDRDPSCHRAFPRLAADWAALLASLARSPWVVPAAHSPFGKPIRLDAGEFVALTHQMMMDPVTAAQLPVLIHALGSSADHAAALVVVTRALLAAGESPQSLAGGSGNTMMVFPIRCYEPWASFRPGALAGQRASFEYQADLQTARWWQYACSLIPRPPAAALGRPQLTVSPVPVLALNGDADPQDPPQNMAGARAFWPDSRELTEPGQSHDVTTLSWVICGDPLTQAFIEQASAARLDASCLATVPAPSFPLSLRALTAGQ